MRINDDVKRFIRNSIETRADSAQDKYRAKLKTLSVSAAQKTRLCSKCEKLYAEYVKKTAEMFEEAGVEFVCFDIVEKLNEHEASYIVERNHLVKKADIEKARDLLDRIRKTQCTHSLVDEIVAKLSLGGDMKMLEKLLSEVKF